MQEYYVQFYNTDARGISKFVEEIVVEAANKLGLIAEAEEYKHINNFSKYCCFKKR